MIDLFFRKFYTLWGSIMLVLPVSVCVAWFVITDGAESAERARMMFMGSCRMFAYYDFTWFLCVFFSALPFFFGLRLVRGNWRSIATGAAMMLVAGSTLVFSIMRIWSV